MRDLLSTLEMISDISPGEKLIVMSKYISVDNRWGQGLRRMWGGESRDSTIQRLVDIYTEIREKLDVEFEKIEDSIQKKSNLYDINDKKSKNMGNAYRSLRLVAESLASSYAGIKNLMVTYSDDSNTVARLRNILIMDIGDMYRSIVEVLPKKFKPNVPLPNNHHRSQGSYKSINEIDKEDENKEEDQLNDQQYE